MAKKASTVSKQTAKPKAKKKKASVKARRKPPASSAAPAEEFVWHRKDLIGLDDLSAQEITHILDTAETFREVSTRSVKKVPSLRGKVVALMFFED